ncbi:hypothetical protein MNBD_GAMMA23-339 [hydrothermal vent metagenome]|uniref:Methyltransferase domain-containing protein n=1 Tax=hydrothermal vent metagenome TaxID=652676 RepID=A0A3B0ZZH4_9ZZZZ
MSINNINQAVYTNASVASTYADTSLQSPEIAILVKYKDAFYGKKILDIGCGAGRTSFHFRNFTTDYTAVDYSEEMIQLCKKKYPELPFHTCDARNLSRFDDDSFDFIIFSYNGIDYITNEDRLTVLNEVKRVLKSNGLFVFSTHNLNFTKIITKPTFETSLNPLRLLQNTMEFIRQKKNNNKLKSEQIKERDYSILNDSGDAFSLLTYYITKEKQTIQLNNLGFKTLSIFDMEGKEVGNNANDSSNCWLYFVTQIN